MENKTATPMAIKLELTATEAEALNAVVRFPFNSMEYKEIVDNIFEGNASQAMDSFKASRKLVKAVGDATALKKSAVPVP